MKTFLTIFLLLFSVAFCFSQNSYKKKEFNKIIHSIDKDTMMNIISLSDSAVVGEMCIKYTLSQYYKGRSLAKIELILDNKFELITESYYYDNDGYCIYCIIKEHRYNVLISDFEVKNYSKDNMCFYMDGSQVFFNREEKQKILNSINDDLIMYRALFKQ